MSSIGRFVLALGCLGFMGRADAMCWVDDYRHFGSYCYLTGFGGAPTDLIGTFWSIGSFPSANSGTLPTTVWTRFCSGPSECPNAPVGAIFLAGSWASNVEIVGCPPRYPAEPVMAYAISWPTASGGAVFGGGCDSPDRTTNYNFCFEAPRVVPPQSVPRPEILNVTRSAGQVQILVAPPDVPGGIHNDGRCELGVRGYRVYSQIVPHGGPAPSVRVRSQGWAAASDVISPGQSGVATAACGDGQDVYLAYGLLLDDGVELGHVGANAWVVPCKTNSPEYPVRRSPIRATPPVDAGVTHPPVRK